MDEFAEQADLELSRLAERVQKKWKISSTTMSYILECLAQNYALKHIAESELKEG